MLFKFSITALAICSIPGDAPIPADGRTKRIAAK
jgi:hypothetical protein